MIVNHASHYVQLILRSQTLAEEFATNTFNHYLYSQILRYVPPIFVQVYLT
jgi:hypothetical protein